MKGRQAANICSLESYSIDRRKGGGKEGGGRGGGGAGGGRLNNTSGAGGVSEAGEYTGIEPMSRIEPEEMVSVTPLDVVVAA